MSPVGLNWGFWPPRTWICLYVFVGYPVGSFVDFLVAVEGYDKTQGIVLAVVVVVVVGVVVGIVDMFVD